MNATTQQAARKSSSRAKKPAAPVIEMGAAAEPVIEQRAAPEVTQPAAAPSWTAWPTSASLGFEPVVIPKYFGPAARNSLGVAASWTNSATRAARQTRDGVRVTFEGRTSEFKSVASAFRELRLPFERHIKFRLALKASRKESFTHKDQIYLFSIIDSDPADSAGE